MPETCWAVFKRQVINLRSCCILLVDSVESMMMHGLANPNCYHSVQNLGSSSLLSNNIRIKTYRTKILPVVLYGCETWSLTLREERRLGVFENRVLRRIFGPEGRGDTKVGKTTLGRAKWYVLLTKHHSGDQIETNEMDGACSTFGGLKKCIQGFGGETDHLEDPGVNGRILLRWIFRKWDVGAWTG